jgi:hypothetical protein
VNDLFTLLYNGLEKILYNQVGSKLFRSFCASFEAYFRNCPRGYEGYERRANVAFRFILGLLFSLVLRDD